MIVRPIFSLVTACLVALFAPTVGLTEGKSIIVLDASGSMWGQIDGRAKLEIAREALGTVLESVDPATELGLMVYGHRSKGDCGDIELLVAPGAGTAGAIKSAADNLKFLGKTPLSDAVRLAAAELRSTEEKATVILITDGIETCNADPCALGAELEASGVDFTAHVVGFGLTNDEGKQVACLAEATGGKYIEAKDSGGLVEALKTTVVERAEPEPTPEPEPEPEPVVITANFAPKLFLAAGLPEVSNDEGHSWDLFKIAADGSRGEWVRTEYGHFKGMVDPGTFKLVATLGEAKLETEVTITADELSAPEIVLNAAKVILHPKGSVDGPIDDTASVYLENDNGMGATYYGTAKTYVVSGETRVTVKVGEATVTETLTLQPGETLEKDIVAATGLAVVTPSYIAGQNVEGQEVFIEILAAKAAVDGSRASIAYSYGPSDFALPPGDYLAKVTLGAAVMDTPFSVRVAERIEVSVVLNAGVMAAAGPGVEFFEVLGAAKDINGNRVSYAYGYSNPFQTTLPAGDYVVVARRGQTDVETPATVKAGERTEVNVP